MAENLATSSSTEDKNKLSATAERLCRRFSFEEIRLATDGFNDARLAGKGGFGKVYRGFIDNGLQTVAIKRLELSSNQGAAEFCAEIETLTKLRHINLVSLIGYCNEHEEMILVYEYIAHGTLADHLYKLSRNKDRDESSSLTWKQRLKICIGAGRGLDYLHTGSSIIHRDVKSTNFLLDENFIAKVSDFGLAKHLSASNSQSHVNTIVKGSFGYLDPSYFVTGRLTRKSDIYAFGVVLLEVLCGRPAVDSRLAEDEMSLSIWAREKISKGKVDQIVASNLREEISADCLKIFVGVTKKCLHLDPKKRPTMAQAVVQLEYALEQQDREAATYNALRFLPLNAFWRRVKPSGNRATGTTVNDPNQADINILSVAVPATPEEALKDKHTVNMLPVATAIPLYELKDIMNNFSFRSSIGGVLKLGSVYSGVLKNGQAVAIKTLDYSRQSNMEFLTQVSLISSLKHENMTQLLGYYVDGARQLLAYEFAPNGSLHDILHERKAARGSEQSPALTWVQRVKIALGAAKGLEYIHEKGQLHLNIKSSNILIFNGEVAKIADFGLPSEAPNGGLPWYEDVSHNQPPELIRKSDTYAFGVVLLEVLCGRPAVDPRLAENEMSLVMWAREKISEGKVDEIVASTLRLEISADSLKTFVRVAKKCLDLEPEKRPTMGKVAVRLFLALKQQQTHNASRFFALSNRGAIGRLSRSI